MQTDARLIEDIQHAHEGRADLRRKPDALTFTAGERTRRARKRQIAKTDAFQKAQSCRYFYLTELAAKCTAKRMVPDYISEKIMKQLKGGDVYTCMGCRSFLTPDRFTDKGLTISPTPGTMIPQNTNTMAALIRAWSR